MALIGSPDTDYTIRGIIKYTSCINKDSAVYEMIDLLHMPMGAVSISMFYMICFYILHYAIPEPVLYWKVCFIYLLFRGDYYTSPESYLRFYLYVCA